MRNKEEYYQLIPENVLRVLNAIESILSKQIPGFCPDNLKQVINIVAYNTRKDKKNYSLKMEYIKRYVPQGDKYLKGLRKLGIIDRNGYAIPGKTSYKYSFNPDYMSKYVKVPLNNPRLIRRIKNTRKKIRRESANSIKNRSEQTKHLMQVTLDEGYLEYLETTYTSSTIQYNYAMSTTTRIVNKDFFYTVDTTSFRFHSNITNLQSGFTPYLRIDGEPLVSIDIKNCQPYLSTIILTNPSKVSQFAKSDSLKTLLESMIVPKSPDIVKYIGLVLAGQLYEHLMSVFSIDGLELNRDETKEQVLRILFAPNRMPKNKTNGKARKIFAREFPRVHQTFSKVRGNEMGDKFNSYKRFAILLTRIESYLVIEVIIERIAREVPGAKIVSKHDCILTGINSGNFEEVRQIMLEELTRFIGFPPSLKIDGYTSND